ncbi:MAG: LLM class flavin-dependent oxidoreductase [Chloroflexi bacterium]|nr:LLM class flavin-dependent oxidoreductase [Chloroflexota bacterium]
MAEDAGFDFVLIAEHHFSNYGMSPAPLLEALVLAQATTRIRIGTAVSVLPEWQPVRLAEEMAIVDQLSGGRLIAGVGRGFVHMEHEGFGGRYDASRAAFDEGIEVLLKAWTEEDFTFEGEHVRVSRPTTVLPRPLQQPHPPIWLAGTSEESFDLIGRLGAGAIAAGGDLTSLRRTRDAVRAARVQHGHPEDRLTLIGHAYGHVAPTEDALHRCVAAARWQRRAATATVQGKVSGGAVDVQSVEGELDDDAFLASMLAGTPEQMVERIRVLEAEGVTHISMLHQFGGLPHEMILESTRLMGEAVIPAFR